MRRLRILMQGVPAGFLVELEAGSRYRFEYDPDYEGPPVSLTLPVREEPFEFDRFPSFFDGLLPEGSILAALLRQNDLDPDDYMGQLLAAGEDPVGAVSIEAME